MHGSCGTSSEFLGRQDFDLAMAELVEGSVHPRLGSDALVLQAVRHCGEKVSVLAGLAQALDQISAT